MKAVNYDFLNKFGLIGIKAYGSKLLGKGVWFKNELYVIAAITKGSVCTTYILISPFIEEFIAVRSYRLHKILNNKPLLLAEKTA